MADEISFQLNLNDNSLSTLRAMRRELKGATTDAGNYANNLDRAAAALQRYATAAASINPMQMGGGGGRSGGRGLGPLDHASMDEARRAQQIKEYDTRYTGIGPPTQAAYDEARRLKEIRDLDLRDAQAKKTTLTNQYRAVVEQNEKVYSASIGRLKTQQVQLLADMQKAPNSTVFERMRHQAEELSQSIDRLRNGASTNTSRGRLTEVGSEKQLQTLLAGSEAQMRQFRLGVKGLEEDFTHLNNQALPKTNDLMGGFLTSMQHIAVAAIGWAVVGVITDSISALNAELNQTIESAARMDRYRRSFTQLMGAQGAGNLQQVQAFARKTPFDLEDTISQSQRLYATGMKWQQVIPTMHAAANAIARIGGSNEQMTGLNKALTDVQAKSKLAGQEIIQFANAGVDILSVLASQTGKTRTEILRLSEAGQISGETVLKAFRNWSREQGDFLKAQSEDYLGVQQNLTDVRFELEATFGETAMKVRTKSAKDLMDAMSSPGAQKTAEYWGRTFGIVEAGFNILQKATINELSLVSFAMAKLSGSFSGSLAEWITQTTDLNQNLAGTKEALGNLNGGNWESKIQAEIDALKKRNSELDKERSLREALRSLKASEADLEYAQRMAIDVFSPVGIQSRERIPGLEAQWAQNYANLAEERQRQADSRRIDELEQQKLLGDPAVVAATASRSGSFGVSMGHQGSSGNFILSGGFFNGQALSRPSIDGGGSFGGNVPIGRRALGGYVQANSTYVVGERGPELLHMGGNGYVSPGASGVASGYCIGCMQQIALGTLSTDQGRQAVGRALVSESGRPY